MKKKVHTNVSKNYFLRYKIYPFEIGIGPCRYTRQHVLFGTQVEWEKNMTGEETNGFEENPDRD